MSFRDCSIAYATVVTIKLKNKKASVFAVRKLVMRDINKLACFCKNREIIMVVEIISSPRYCLCQVEYFSKWFEVGNNPFRFKMGFMLLTTLFYGFTKHIRSTLNFRLIQDFIFFTFYWMQHSSQVFRYWLKCRKKPKIYSHQIWTVYVLPFWRYCSSKMKIFLFLQYCHFASIVTKINFWKVGLNLFTWKAADLQFWLFTSFGPQHCRKILLESYEHAITFWNFVCSWQPWQNC